MYWGLGAHDLEEVILKNLINMAENRAGLALPGFHRPLAPPAGQTQQPAPYLIQCILVRVLSSIKVYFVFFYMKPH